MYKEEINEIAVDLLLSKDLGSGGYEDIVIKSIKRSLNQNGYDVLVALAFNIGVNAFKNSTVVKMINNPNESYSYNKIEEAWLSWSKSQGKFNQGVNNRRKSEYHLFSQGKYTR